MMSLCCKVLEALKGKTLVTAESCTGGGIGAALTAVPGSSAVYKGGIISYSNWVKAHILGVNCFLLKEIGPVSAAVAQAMAEGARRSLEADVAVSVTGLAGPGGDEYGNSEGTVFVGCASDLGTRVEEFHFSGSRQEIRSLACAAALKLVLKCVTGEETL